MLKSIALIMASDVVVLCFFLVLSVAVYGLFRGHWTSRGRKLQESQLISDAASLLGVRHWSNAVKSMKLST